MKEVNLESIRLKAKKTKLRNQKLKITNYTFLTFKIWEFHLSIWMKVITFRFKLHVPQVVKDLISLTAEANQLAFYLISGLK